MRKILLLLIVLPLFLIGQGRYEPVFYTPDAVTAFGIALPKDMLVYDKGAKNLWVLDAVAASTDNLTTATKSAISGSDVWEYLNDSTLISERFVGVGASAYDMSPWFYKEFNVGGEVSLISDPFEYSPWGYWVDGHLIAWRSGTNLGLGDPNADYLGSMGVSLICGDDNLTDTVSGLYNNIFGRANLTGDSIAYYSNIFGDYNMPNVKFTYMSTIFGSSNINAMDSVNGIHIFGTANFNSATRLEKAFSMGYRSFFGDTTDVEVFGAGNDVRYGGKWTRAYIGIGEENGKGIAVDTNTINFGHYSTIGNNSINIGNRNSLGSSTYKYSFGHKNRILWDANVTNATMNHRTMDVYAETTFKDDVNVDDSLYVTGKVIAGGTISSTTGFDPNVVNAGPNTYVSTGYESVILVANDADGVAITLTTPTYNQIVTIKVIVAGVGNVVITPAAGTIDGAANINLGATLWIRRTLVYSTSYGLWYILNNS